MKSLHVITPVKDAIDLTLQTIDAIYQSKITIPFTYTLYNDFSTQENTRLLEEAAGKYGFNLVNLADITDHPSPNYLLILQIAQEKAIEEEAALCIVESDVIIYPETLQQLYDGAIERPDCGIAGAITIDHDGIINYPYVWAREKESKIVETQKHLSFCCSLLTNPFLRAFDFKNLDPTKSWFDVTISHQSLKMNFKNYLFANLPVLHLPHGSRPWKQLKYKNPLKYYWLKLLHKRDKI